MAKKKCYVLMVSKQFPCYHPKAGKPTEFALKIKHYDKIHTLRANYHFWAKRFKQIDAGKAYLSVRQWEGKPYQSKQHEIFRYDNTHGIGLQQVSVLYPENLVDIRGNLFLYPLKLLAVNDGLTQDEFLDWFADTEIEDYALIHFTKFRYK